MAGQEWDIWIDADGRICTGAHLHVGRLYYQRAGSLDVIKVCAGGDPNAWSLLRIDQVPTAVRLALAPLGAVDLQTQLTESLSSMVDRISEALTEAEALARNGVPSAEVVARALRDLVNTKVLERCAGEADAVVSRAATLEDADSGLDTGAC